MLACSQHTAHLLQKSNHFGPKQSKSRQADLRWGLTWARLSQQSIRFKWFNHEYNFLQAQQLLQPGSWSLQIVPRMPQDAHGRNIQSLWPSAPNRALLQDHCITRSLPRVFIDLFTIPPDREWKTPFSKHCYFSGPMFLLGAGIYVLPPRRKTKHFLGKRNHNVTINIWWSWRLPKILTISISP